MKIKSDFFENNLKNNSKNINIIFLYGTNLGLIDLLYEKTLEILEIDTNDPFNFSKIDGDNLKDNPASLFDNICTLSMFSNRRYTLLDLKFISITKIIENIIIEAIDKINDNNILIIKGGNLKQNSFIKHLQKINQAILVSCYEETSHTISLKISNLFLKHKLHFKEKFIDILTHKFSSDSLANKMEIDKLDNFLTNNNSVTEEMILKLISNKDDLNFNKIIEFCTNGNPKSALYYFENFYENQSTTITIIRMFMNHFKLIEKILLLVNSNNSLINVIDNLRPPIFFKRKEFIIFQCKLWNIKTINKILTRLIELELKCKLNLLSEKTLLSQFILSTSVLAKNRIKT